MFSTFPRATVAALSLITWLAGCASAPPEPATCPSDAATAERVRLYNALTPLPALDPALTVEGAQCGARKFIAALAPTHGRVVGYKAGLTNPAVQKRFGVNTPAAGTLLEKMLHSDGAELPAKFGAVPFMEPDLVVEVGSSAIHDATTPEQVLGSLRAVWPFIELPDVLLADASKINMPSLLLLNVGARAGVLGAPVAVRADAAFANALRDMSVRTTDGTGKELSKAPGAAILGHPLNAVIWLAADLKRRGITLQPGDLLSLGAFGNVAVAPGQVLTVQYDGLPGNPKVSVRFK